MKPGKFIVMEGVNSCGKTLQKDMLHKRLISEGFSSISTDEPTYDLPIGKIIREVYLKGKRKADNLLMANLYALDRYDQIAHPTMGTKRIIEQGINVVQSRNYLSSLAIDTTDDSDIYNIDYVNEINKISTRILKPDVIFIIDISKDKILERFKKLEVRDIFESDEMLLRSYDNYKKAIEYCIDKNGENIVLIDGDKSAEEIHKDIWEYTYKLLTVDD